MISELKMKEVTYVNGTIAGGYSMNKIQTPSNCLLKTNMSMIIRQTGIYAMKISKSKFDDQ